MDHIVGQTIVNDIINEYGVTIVPANTTISKESLQLILNHKIDLESISFLRREESREELTTLVNETVKKAKGLFESIHASRKIPVLEIRNEIIPAIQAACNTNNVFELFDAVRAKDDYTYEHNVGVGILSTYIGRWMGLSETELSILSLGAILHDVGKVKIPQHILTKPGKLTDDEFQQVKKHTIYGYELMKDTPGLNPRIALIALQHHEREDGSGYPLGIKGNQIDPLSSIVAVADIYHAMSSKRPYHAPIPFYEIVTQMRDGKFGVLNPNIVSVFLENVMKKLVGEQVVLTDDRMGEVVYLNPHRIETPLIKVDNEFIDLSLSSTIQIKEIRI
ncbi:MAG: HD-GYP domain-containing protein [Candidatus Cohnella colombiensis]|uniref:HD-GYP domain-containing protein n=1 Tax=Candidatus Cohnella colombiensis TaxID=3121368 RepID=A0AA95EVM0_9BACL|nr:MAG: HD-GYP domain-containing protein [Cohnella sp.]